MVAASFSANKICYDYPMLKAYKYSEADCQAQVVKWLDLLQAQTKKIFYFSFPFECLERKRLGTAKRLGFKAGIPDLIIMTDAPAIGFFELKTGVTRVSENQKIVHNILRKLGFAIYVVRADTPNEMTDKISEILVNDFNFKEAEILK